jgi:hypothetical protein
MKYTGLFKSDDLDNLPLPPGATLHLSDGQQIQSTELSLHLERGEAIEARVDGKRFCRIRNPNTDGRFTPRGLNAMGQALERAQRDRFVNAINWIDRDKDRFWCAVCAKNQSHPGGFGAWISPDPDCREVCYYAVCRKCTKEGESRQQRNDIEGHRRIADLTEHQILTRYPHVAVSLPPGYMDRSNE